MVALTETSANQLVRQCFSDSRSRFDSWAEFIRAAAIQCMAEIGVYQGDFAATVLQRCEHVSRYYMVDPWRHLDDWNKPDNEQDVVLEDCLRLTKQKTDFAASRRIILRGKTTEVIDEIKDDELDFAYIDGDHTLKGITIDIVRLYGKVRQGGFLGGDDFCSPIWQHKTSFEPTLVFPFVVYFAEAVGATIYALPNAQFCLHKREQPQFSFIDLTGLYRNLDLRSQLTPGKLLMQSLSERIPGLARVVEKARKLI